MHCRKDLGCDRCISIQLLVTVSYHLTVDFQSFCGGVGRFLLSSELWSQNETVSDKEMEGDTSQHSSTGGPTLKSKHIASLRTSEVVFKVLP